MHSDRGYGSETHVVSRDSIIHEELLDTCCQAGSAGDRQGFPLPSCCPPKQLDELKVLFFLAKIIRLSDETLSVWRSGRLAPAPAAQMFFRDN